MAPADNPTSPKPGEEHRSDGVFEGGGVKGIAFAGALAAAENAGITEWVNVAGTSAGAIAAALVAAGFDAEHLHTALKTDYGKFADYGPGGKWISGPWNALTRRGLAHGDYFKEWLGERLGEVKAQGADLTFGDLVRDDLPADISEEARERARYRLRVIASDITGSRMLVLPDDISDYCDEEGNALSPDELKVVDGVRMSMSFPFFFEPVTLYRRPDDDPDKDPLPHLIVDGGLLSNFPVWLFDAQDPNRPPARPTWGFRLHAGEGKEKPPYHEIHRPLWEIGMARALFSTAMEAWDVRLSARSLARTISIPTGDVKTLDFELSEKDSRYLYDQGRKAAEEAFAERGRNPLAKPLPTAGPTGSPER